MAEERGYQIPLTHYIPDDLELRFANNITVQHTEHEFIIGFYEVQPPLMLGTPEERRAKAEQLESVPAKCVARVVISPGRMQEFVNVLQDNLERYLSSVETRMKDE